MPQFLYQTLLARPDMLTSGPSDHEARIIDDHFAYLSALTAQGTVLMAGRTLTEDADTFGLVVLVAASAEEAEDLMNQDPAVKHGVMRARLFPYRVALWSAQGPGEEPTT